MSIVIGVPLTDARPSRPAAARHGARRRLGVVVRAALLVAALGALGLVLWPRSFGGPVSYVKVSGTSMEPTFRPGDLVVMRSHPSYRVGDVVAYVIPAGEFAAGHVVVHRIVGGSAATGLVTKGDNRTVVDPWHPRAADVLGRRWFDVHGWAPVLDALRSPLRVGGLCGVITFVALSWGARRAANSSRARSDRDAGR